MATNRSGAMVILPVNVIGESAAKRDKARSWSGRRKPTFGNRETQNVRKTDARLCTQDSVLSVEADEAIKAAHVNKRACTIETGIAVGSPQPNRQFAGGARVLLAAHASLTRDGNSSRKRGRAMRCGRRATRPHERISVRSTKGEMLRISILSEHGCTEECHHHRTIEKAQAVLQREGYGIVMQFAAMTKQPNSREPQEDD
jgi:hypothetical protein